MTPIGPAPASLVSSAIQVTSDQLREPARRALAAIDRVHLVAGLPRIPLDTRRDDPNFQGHYRIKRYSERALGIGIAPDDPIPELLILHEIGHFIDHQALGRPGAWAAAIVPDLREWRRAIEATGPIQELHALLGLTDIAFALAAGGGNLLERRATVSYLLTYTEASARCYAQYIATRSGDPLLLDQLANLRAAGDVIWRLAHWSDPAFAPIAAAIDHLFRQKGWLR